MPSDVKANTQALLAPRPNLWMAYFLVTILLIGVPLSVFFYIPLFFLSFFFPRTQIWADRLLRWGIEWLMRVQPWFDGEFDLQIPSGGVLLASNHRSHLDVFCLLSRVAGIRVLAKSSLFYIPLLNIMMFVSRQIPTRRGRVDSFWRAMSTVKARLLSGDRVHVFPEMTRCEAGFQGTRDFMIAPFLMAKESGRPVVPLVIEGTDQAWPRGSFSLRARQPVRLRTLAALDPRDFTTAEALRDATRQRIDEALA